MINDRLSEIPFYHVVSLSFASIAVSSRVREVGKLPALFIIYDSFFSSTAP
jgi:hypothetical protein